MFFSNLKIIVVKITRDSLTCNVENDLAAINVVRLVILSHSRPAGALCRWGGGSPCYQPARSEKKKMQKNCIVLLTSALLFSLCVQVSLLFVM